MFVNLVAFERFRKIDALKSFDKLSEYECDLVFIELLDIA